MVSTDIFPLPAAERGMTFFASISSLPQNKWVFLHGASLYSDSLERGNTTAV